MMDGSLGREEVAAVVAVLVLVGGASLWFTHVQEKAGVMTRAGRITGGVFTVASWATSLGAILRWSLVLAELALGPISPVNPWVLAITCAVAAPPVGQMSRRLTPADPEIKPDEDGGGA